MRADTILVIPFADGIGDFINAQPLLAALKRRFPRAEIAVAASEHGGRLINDPTIDVVKPSSLGVELGRVASAIRPYFPQKLLAWVAGPTFDRELGPFDLVINYFFAWEKGMNFKTYWVPQVPPIPGAIHSLDYLANEMERLLDMTITPAQRKPRLVIRPAAGTWAARFWTEHDLDSHDGRVVGLVPSSNMVIKHWPLRNWLTLDAHLRELGYRTLLFCDRREGSTQKAFAQAGSSALPVYTTLDNVAGVLANCDLVVGVDTGLLHMAAALNVPWVGLFGPTNPEVTGPYDRTRGISLVAPFPKQPTCAPCWKHFKYEKDLCYTLPQGSCLDYLDEADVLQACLDILGKFAEPEESVGTLAR
jgi:ADP-heptose:LPS heptosyltransferase